MTEKRYAGSRNFAAARFSVEIKTRILSCSCALSAIFQSFCRFTDLARRVHSSEPANMDLLSTTAASGLRSRMESLDLLANNIANSETSGYKVDREFYSLYTSAEAANSDGPDPATLPVIEKNFTDFSQGALHTTSNPLDLSLMGSGLFAVSTPGGTAYTRNGSFQLSPSGSLTTGDGNKVLSTTGQPITIDPSQPFTVTPGGTVLQSGQTLGQISVVDFPQGDLVKQGNTLFRPGNPKAVGRPSSAQVLQGKVEASNVGASEGAIRLVNVMRQFEILQKAVNIAGEMDRKAITDVAKVGA